MMNKDSIPVIVLPGTTVQGVKHTTSNLLHMPAEQADAMVVQGVALNPLAAFTVLADSATNPANKAALGVAIKLVAQHGEMVRALLDAAETFSGLAADQDDPAGEKADEITRLLNRIGVGAGGDPIVPAQNTWGGEIKDDHGLGARVRLVRLIEERNTLENSFGYGPVADGDTRDRLTKVNEAIDKIIAVPVTISVSPYTIANEFVSAIEGGSTYWLRGVRLVASDHSPKATPWYDDRLLYVGDFQIEATYDDPAKEEGNGQGVKVITKQDLDKGLALMASKHARHFGDLVSETGDAITADVLMQCIVLGDVIYG